MQLQMDTLLEKVSDSGLDATSVDGEKAISFWKHVRNHIVSTPSERALCYAMLLAQNTVMN